MDDKKLMEQCMEDVKTMTTDKSEVTQIALKLFDTRSKDIKHNEYIDNLVRYVKNNY